MKTYVNVCVCVSKRESICLLHSIIFEHECFIQSFVSMSLCCQLTSTFLSKNKICLYCIMRLACFPKLHLKRLLVNALFD